MRVMLVFFLFRSSSIIADKAIQAVSQPGQATETAINKALRRSAMHGKGGHLFPGGLLFSGILHHITTFGLLRVEENS